MNRMIVTSADENYAHLLLDLLSSLARWENRPFDAIGILDVGLSEATLEEVRKHATHIVVPDWDLPVDPETRAARPYMRASTARPFLRKYFPDSERILWLDSDTWVQEKSAVEVLFEVCAEGGMGIVPQADRAYKSTRALIKWRQSRMRNYYGNDAAGLVETNPYYNAGVFSLHKDAPHWHLWAEYLAAGFSRYPGLVCNQTSLNFLLWRESLPVRPLPATFNWCCHLGRPAINMNTRKVVLPYAPYSPIGIIHLTSDVADMSFTLKINNETVSTALRYSDFALIFDRIKQSRAQRSE